MKLRGLQGHAPLESRQEVHRSRGYGLRQTGKGCRRHDPAGRSQSPNGIDIDTARKVVKLIKETKIKVQSAIQGEEVRVTGKKRDDLQESDHRLEGGRPGGCPSSSSTTANDRAGRARGRPSLLLRRRPARGDPRIARPTVGPTQLAASPAAFPERSCWARSDLTSSSLMGGPWPNPSSTGSQHACREHRLAALRFNFRGVGKSRGSYSGIDEHRDIEAAAAFLRGRVGPDIPVALAGYSFGKCDDRYGGRWPTPWKPLALVAFVATMQGMPHGRFRQIARLSGAGSGRMWRRGRVGPTGGVDAVLRDLRLDFRLIVVQGADQFLRWEAGRGGGLPWRPSWRARSGGEDALGLRLGSGRRGTKAARPAL